MTMEMAGSQNLSVGKRAPKTKKGLREHMGQDSQQPSIGDPLKGGKGVGRTTSAGDLFDDFDDPFEDERDHATTVTPVDKPEQERNANSPNGVDDLDFDPFREITDKKSSFYHSPEIDGEISLRMSSTGSQSFGDLSLGEGTDAGNAPETPAPSHKSTMGRFTSVTDLRKNEGFEDSLAVKSPAMRMAPRTPRNAGTGDQLSSHSGHGDLRSMWQRRASMSNLSLSNHSGHSTQSEFDGLNGMRRAGKRPGNEDSADSAFKVTASRPSWGRRASTSNLNSSDSPDFCSPGTSRYGMKRVNSTDDSVQTPVGMKMGIGAPKRLSMTPVSMGPRRASMCAATTQMMPTPKKSTTKMVRRASVATGMGSESQTKKLSRRSSVGSALESEQSGTTSKARIRIRQQRRGAGSKLKGPVDEDNVRRLIKEHLAKERLNKEGAPSHKGPVDEDNVRRMIKEHITKQKTKKKEGQGDREEDDDEDGVEQKSGDEDKTHRSDSDDEASVSSSSTATSSSSRWEDDAIHGDNVPRLLERQESCDGDTLLDWTPDQAAELLRDRRAGRKPKLGSKDKNGKAETEEGQEARKKPKKPAKKAKKETKEKKVKKEKKEKKKSRAKPKSKSKDEDKDDDDHSVHSSMANSAASFFGDSEPEEEVKTTKKKTEKKTKKEKKKMKKGKGTKTSTEKDEDDQSREGTINSEDRSAPVDDDRSDYE